jgi:predicted metalloprotease with PDZ domain
MKYTVSCENPHHHYIDIEFTVEGVSSDELAVQLPAWRPGRYELGNFAKNVQKWAAFDEGGKQLEARKTSKDKWIVQSGGAKTVTIRYNYFANELNAGSTYLDPSQLYINPVNCFLFIPGREKEKCTVELKVPADYRVATSMKKRSEHVLEAADFDELADSPLIASNTIKHNLFVLDGIEFNLWMQGECKPNWSRIINDFFIFINEQFMMMKEFPAETYHFLFQIVPYKFYHGVEHKASTVIALGPSYKLMKDELYNELLGVSSHELFHCWNIKTIRPVEMHPYDYTKENYSRLGYVYEGVTTYYGDLLLFRSGVFSEFEYFKTVYDHLQKHFDNFGRLNLSVADSSFDTWLDGYVPGVPNRKVSIYTEGSLIAFMTDILIRRHTKNESSLDDVMRTLYYEFAKKGRGYDERDYKGIVEHIANASFDDFFRKYVYGTDSFEPMLRETLDYIGCDLRHTRSRKYHEAFYGIKISEQHNAGAKITAVYPGSVADLAELGVGDEIMAVNGIQVKGDFTDWARYFAAETVEILVARGIQVRKISLSPVKEEYYKLYYINKKADITDEQRVAFESWSKRRF